MLQSYKNYYNYINHSHGSDIRAVVCYFFFFFNGGKRISSREEIIRGKRVIKPKEIRANPYQRKVLLAGWKFRVDTSFVAILSVNLYFRRVTRFYVPRSSHPCTNTYSAWKICMQETCIETATSLPCNSSSSFLSIEIFRARITRFTRC